jgi:hypothetical protein
LTLWRFIRQKPLTDRSVGKALKFFREACVIEDMTAGAKDLIERFQMKCVGSVSVPSMSNSNAFPDPFNIKTFSP